MSRSHLIRVIQDAQGNLRLAAQIRVFDDQTITLTNEPLYAAETGTATLASTHNVVNGTVDFWTAGPKRFRIGIKVGDEPEIIFEGVDSLSPDAGTTLGGHPSSFFYSPDNPPPGSAGVATTNTGGSTTLTDANNFYFADATNATVTLPTPVGRTGREFTVKNLNVTNCTVATAAGTIDALATRTLAQYDSISVISNGSTWSVV